MAIIYTNIKYCCSFVFDPERSNRLPVPVYINYSVLITDSLPQ